MQVSSTLERDDILMDEPEKEDVDMDVELGINLVDTFTKNHVFVTQNSTTQLPVSVDFSAVNVELDDITQEVLRTALLELKDTTPMEVGSMSLSFPEWGDPETRKLEMVVYLYAFEKFRIVYA